MRVDGAPARSCAASSTAASGSRATRCTSSCCTRPTSSATRTRSTWRRTIPRSVERGLCAQEDRQRDRHGRGRPRGAPRQRAGGRLLPPARRRASWRGWPNAQDGARRGAETLVRFVAAFDFPDFDTRLRAVALRHPDEYPMNEGRIVSSEGLDIADRGLRASTSRRTTSRTPTRSTPCRRARGAYCVGPLARYSLNFDRLSPLRRRPRGRRASGRSAGIPSRASWCAASRRSSPATRRSGSSTPTTPPERRPSSRSPARAGCGCTEAPRGLLYHRYRLDADGRHPGRADRAADRAEPEVRSRHDLRALRPGHGSTCAEDELTCQCEQAIRNYDPCISCATHFLSCGSNGSDVHDRPRHRCRQRHSAATTRRGSWRCGGCTSVSRPASGCSSITSDVLGLLDAGRPTDAVVARGCACSSGARAGHGSPLRRARGTAPVPDAGRSSTHAPRRGRGGSISGASCACSPRASILYGIEVARVEPGAGVTPAVAGAVEEVALAILADLALA